MRKFSLACILCLPFILGTSLMADTTPPSIQAFDKRAAAGDHLNVVFFGGSLTYGANASDPQLTSYRGLMMQYLINKYPKASFTFWDAAIGGTGSDLGIFRLERDVLKRKPDLTFLEFTMNDGAEDSDVQHLATYEHLLRSLYESNSAVFPIILCFKYHVNKPGLPVPPRVTDHIKLYEAYNTPYSNVFKAVREGVDSGKFKPEDLWAINHGKDGAHPDDPGYKFFFDTIKASYEDAVQSGQTPKVPDQAVFGDLYPHVERVILVDQPLPKGWTREQTRRTSMWFDGLSSRWMGEVAAAGLPVVPHAAAPAAPAPGASPAASASPDASATPVVPPTPPEPLVIKFHGSLVGIFGEKDAVTPPFRVWIDDKPITQPKAKPADENIWHIDTSKSALPKPNNGNLFAWNLLAKDLTDGDHVLRIEPIFDDKTIPGAQLRIESVCAAGK